MRPGIVIIDLGSQYAQLIARRIRSLRVYCEIHSCRTMPPAHEHIKGVILSGSPYAVHDSEAPQPFITHYVRARIPILGICYGAQWLIHQEKEGQVLRSSQREYGAAALHVLGTSTLLAGVTASQVWMSHGDSIQRMPVHYQAIARTRAIPFAAFQCIARGLYGLQFHPEVTQTTMGETILRNYVQSICHCSPDWMPQAFLEQQTKVVQETVSPQDKVLMALSGGVDSSVAALLIHRARPGCLRGVFVDHGLLRKNERSTILAIYKRMGIRVRVISAKTIFYNALAGVSDPERKRKAIGHAFVGVFERHSRAVAAQWLGQGTIYPDVIESTSAGGPSKTIKSHHNVGGLPKNMSMRLIEPLRALFKDEVREVGKLLGLPQEILQRHPFPGPGLAVRIIGAVTPKKVRILQAADDIFIRILKAHAHYDAIWQAGVMLLPMCSTGVMGDARTYQHAVVLRAVCSTDGMTATSAQLPHELLTTIATTIVNEVDGINRVVYDLSSKPPATIEWE